MSAQGNGDKSSLRTIYVTLKGLPLSFGFEWPFRKSTSGADFWVLHCDIRLANTDDLHAPVSVNLSATVREVMPSLEPKDAEAPVIAALRKEIDQRQVEFVRSGKLVPVNFSSRHYDFNRNRWFFGHASEDDITAFLERKIYWQTQLVGGNVWLADPAEALYLNTTTDHLTEVAGKMAKAGMVTVENQYANANQSLMALRERFESAAAEALKELETKHEFERG
jgi:hypothetical protein